MLGLISLVLKSWLNLVYLEFTYVFLLIVLNLSLSFISVVFVLDLPSLVLEPWLDLLYF